MAYKEIINEIQEQIDELQARHDEKVAEMTAIEEELPTLLQQIQSLGVLKANAQELSNSVDVNVNINVNSSGAASVSTVDHAVTG